MIRQKDGGQLESPSGTAEILRCAEAILVDMMGPSAAICGLIRALDIIPRMQRD